MAILEIFAFLDGLEAWFRLGNPEFVGWVGVDADVGLGDCACSRHYEVGGEEKRGREQSW